MENIQQNQLRMEFEGLADFYFNNFTNNSNNVGNAISFKKNNFIYNIFRIVSNGSASYQFNKTNQNEYNIIANNQYTENDLRECNLYLKFNLPHLIFSRIEKDLNNINQNQDAINYQFAKKFKISETDLNQQIKGFDGNNYNCKTTLTFDDNEIMQFLSKKEDGNIVARDKITDPDFMREIAISELNLFRLAINKNQIANNQYNQEIKEFYNKFIANQQLIASNIFENQQIKVNSYNIAINNQQYQLYKLNDQYFAISDNCGLPIDNSNFVNNILNKFSEINLQNGICRARNINDKLIAITKYNNGDIYDGEWANNKPNGNGEMKYFDGDNYQGNWLDGKKQGYGTLITQDNISYNGEWFNDKKHGLGTEINHEEEIKYQGSWFDNKKHGNGKITYHDNSHYQGEFANNHPKFFYPEEEVNNFNLKLDEFEFNKHTFKFKKGSDYIELISGDLHIQINERSRSSIDEGIFRNKKLYDYIMGGGDLESLEKNEKLQNWLDDIFLQNSRAGIFCKDNKNPCYSYKKDSVNGSEIVNISFGKAEDNNFTNTENFKAFMENKNDYFLVKLPNIDGSSGNQYIKFNLVFDDATKTVMPKISETGRYDEIEGIRLYDGNGGSIRDDEGFPSAITKENLRNILQEKNMTISCNLSYFDEKGLNLLGSYECNVAGDFSFELVKNQNVFDQNDNSKLSEIGGYEYTDDEQKEEYKTKQQQYFNSQLNEFLNQGSLRGKLGISFGKFESYVKGKIANNKEIQELDDELRKYADQLVKKYQDAVKAIEEKFNEKPDANFRPINYCQLNNRQQQK